MSDALLFRHCGPPDLPALIYLPGIHGDWTLVGSFRALMARHVHWIEFTYPRTTTWSLDDYARAVLDALCAHGISRGWLLGESFGSQVLWRVLANAGSGFRAEGVILAGGFVRYPWPWVLPLARATFDGTPVWAWRLMAWGYRRYAKFRHRHAQETLGDVDEFLRRRMEPGDLGAMRHRLELISAHDPRLIAQAVQAPVYCLVGGMDPIVPAPPVWRWLKRHCPAWVGRQIIWNADHNVLGTAPARSAEAVLAWVRAGWSISLSPFHQGRVGGDCQP